MITSTGNKRVKELAQLVKKAKERRIQGVFVVEGKKMYKEAPTDWVREVYVSDSFLKEPENQKLVASCNYEVLADHVFSSVSDTITPQGILSVVAMPHYEEKLFFSCDNGMYLVLESIQDPGNLGTMFRTAEGAGVSGIIMNKETVDLFYPKTIRSTMGSIYRVPFLITDDLKKILSDMKKRSIISYAAHLKGEKAYDAFDYAMSCAFVIGNEGNGLSKEIADMTDTYIRIPMQGKVESLNAAIAAWVLMFEAARQRRK